MDYNHYKNELNKLIKNNASKEEIVLFMEGYTNKFPKYSVSIGKATFALIKDTHTIIALELIEPILENINDIKFLKVVKNRYIEMNEMKKAKNLEKRCKSLNKKFLVQQAVDKFNEDKDTKGIDEAMMDMNLFLNKYYYLERTILKKVHKNIKSDFPEVACEIAKKLLTKFDEKEYKSVC